MKYYDYTNTKKYSHSYTYIIIENLSVLQKKKIMEHDNGNSEIKLYNLSY